MTLSPGTRLAPDGWFLMIRRGSAATDDATAAPELVVVLVAQTGRPLERRHRLTRPGTLNIRLSVRRARRGPLLVAG